MKDRYQAPIQFSGYPLSVSKAKQVCRQPAKPLRPKLFFERTTAIQQNQISNDPRNWDLSWFASYE
ncbi:MAG TPA: hypothetical protein VFR58_15930 [Flavisolibacter sp.]|nr:hypothetical protein [Flavisolibacter sp.]